jgi:RNA polymerase sigma factor (sigma-70 family)
MCEPRKPAPPLIRQVLIGAHDTGVGGGAGAGGIAPGVRPAAAETPRESAAVALLQRHRDVLLRVARRHSLCADDADDALQRASLILLTKGPAIDPRRLVGWMFVVTRHEAIAVRRSRQRLVDCLAPGGAIADPLADAAGALPDPANRFERVDAAREAIATLKANERLAITLQAEGYSYAEICELCGWTYTKVNRSLAKGRARLRAVTETA